MQSVGQYVEEWESATTRVWPTNEVFNLEEFNGYLRWYMTATRLRLFPASDPVEVPAPTDHDRYPSQSTLGSRHHAVRASSLSSLSSFYTLGRKSLVLLDCRLT